MGEFINVHLSIMNVLLLIFKAAKLQNLSIITKFFYFLSLLIKTTFICCKIVSEKEFTDVKKRFSNFKKKSHYYHISCFVGQDIKKNEK